MDPRELHRASLYWRHLLELVAGDLELQAAKEPDPARARWLAGRGKRIRLRIHQGVPADFMAAPNRPPPQFRSEPDAEGAAAQSDHAPRRPRPRDRASRGGRL